MLVSGRVGDENDHHGFINHTTYAGEGMGWEVCVSLDILGGCAPRIGGTWLITMVSKSPK